MTIDPEKRFDFKEIKGHKWYQLYSRKHCIPPGIIVGYNRIPIDFKILK
jgi:5'-AMP-activated protein kinase, catalytic alpha subunit